MKNAMAVQKKTGRGGIYPPPVYRGLNISKLGGGLNAKVIVGLFELRNELRFQGHAKAGSHHLVEHAEGPGKPDAIVSTFPSFFHESCIHF